MMQKLLGTLSLEAAVSSEEEEQAIEALELFFCCRRLGFTYVNRIVDLDEAKLKELVLLLIDEGRR